MKAHSHYVFVWPLCTRLIHWIIALSFFFSFYTSFDHRLFAWHLTFGCVFGMMLLFRFLWGWMGTGYAMFQAFHLSFQALKSYFYQKIQNRWRVIDAGHNAASSWFTLIVLGLGSVSVISGFFLQGMEDGSGLLRALNAHYFRASTPVSLFHQGVAYLLLVCAIVHMIGVMIEQFYHKTHMLFAMISGYKKAQGVDAPLFLFRHLFAYAMVGVACIFIYVSAYAPPTFLIQSSFQKHDYKSENPIFFEKCSKCHKLYPPFMLPHDSWVRLMDGLENHFGEQIGENNITKTEQESIRAYLVSHSAESSSHKLAFKTLDSLGEMRPISMSKVPYWRMTHAKITPEQFQTLHVKKASNCFACHVDFEYGILDTAHLAPSAL